MTVSIVTPNYNNAPYLLRSIGSVLDDPGVDEIVIHDNGSTDGSQDIIRGFGSSKIKLIEGQENLGATLGRHNAIQQSSGELICYLDGDDFLGEHAVSKAIEAQRRYDLDITLFQMFNVDKDGQHPALAIPIDRKPIAGRTACEMTLGGWHMHAWGLIRRTTYERAWSGFTPQGYSDDELLTRRILLAARQVGGSNGEMFYRVTNKPATPYRTKGIILTALGVLRLAADAGLSEEPLRRQRNMVVRFLLGMVRRRLTGEVTREEFAGYFAEYAAVEVPWRPDDRRFRWMDLLLRRLPV